MTITLFPFSKHERVEFPVLIFFDDHHEPFQYYAEDLEEFYKVCLRVLENRLGSYYQDPGEPPKTPEDVTRKMLYRSIRTIKEILLGMKRGEIYISRLKKQ